MQLKLVTIKIWGFDMQRINDTQIRDCKQVNSTACFKIGFFIGYLEIIVKLIIVVDLQINQCKVSIQLLKILTFN